MSIGVNVLCIQSKEYTNTYSFNLKPSHFSFLVFSFDRNHGHIYKWQMLEFNINYSGCDDYFIIFIMDGLRGLSFKTDHAIIGWSFKTLWSMQMCTDMFQNWRSVRINTCYKLFIWKPLYLFWANFCKSLILVHHISTFIATATVLFFHTCDCQIKLAICQSIRSAY